MSGLPKKYMVDFMSAPSDLRRKRFPKTKWNKLTEEQLLQLVRYEVQIENALESYIERDNEEKVAEDFVDNNTKMTNEGTVESPEENVQELFQLVDELIENPHSYQKNVRLRIFMENLPYGMISNDDLGVAIEKIVEKSPMLANMILDYLISQMMSKV